jgi:WD40 repeat protein
MKRWRVGIWVVMAGVMVVAWAAMVVPTEAQTLVLSRSTDMVLTAVDWHPNGELIAVSSWNGIYVYSTGLEEVITVADSDDQWFSAEWSPDGQRLAATNNTSRVTHIWDFDDVNHQFESQIQLPNLGNYEGMIGAHWSPDGTQMITIGDYTTNTDYYGEYQLWDTFSGTRIAVLPFQFGFYTPSVEWSPDGSYIVGGGRFRCPLTQPEGSCDVYGDVMFVVNVSDISAPFWFEEMLIEPNDVAWLTQNTVALLGTFELEIFDFASRERIFMLDNYQNFRMDGSPWGGYVALTSLEGEIGIFDVSTNRVIANFQTGAKNITSLDWSVDNRLVVVDGTGVIEIWDLNALLIQTAIPTPTPRQLLCRLPCQPKLRWRCHKQVWTATRNGRRISSHLMAYSWHWCQQVVSEWGAKTTIWMSNLNIPSVLMSRFGLMFMKSPTVTLWHWMEQPSTRILGETFSIPLETLHGLKHENSVKIGVVGDYRRSANGSTQRQEWII